MANHSRLEVIQKMHEQGLVPLFYHQDIEIAKKVMSACYAGGGRLMEFTNRGDFAHEVFSELSKFAQADLPELMLGVGSVPDAPTAAIFIQMGANFVVSPSLREDVAVICNRRKVPYLPGCGSLTEIGRAEELGCEIVKLFPGSVYGPDFVKSVKAPQPWTDIMITGGVWTEKENLQSWFDAGACCVGLGSNLISKHIIAEEEFKSLEVKVRETLERIKSIRKGEKSV